jgi:predicted HTH transcriptional regulator
VLPLGEKMDINKLFKSPESKTLEFKRDTSALKQIMRTIVAFANTAGGTIVIGLEDNGDVVVSVWFENILIRFKYSQCDTIPH